jgi:hypothetical protein
MWLPIALYPPLPILNIVTGWSPNRRTKMQFPPYYPPKLFIANDDGAPEKTKLIQTCRKHYAYELAVDGGVYFSDYPLQDGRPASRPTGELKCAPFSIAFPTHWKLAIPYPREKKPSAIPAGSATTMNALTA